MKNAFKICVCASGGGGNFQALIDSQDIVGYSIVKLITDRECKAVDRAKNNVIDFVVLNKKKLKEKFFNSLENQIPLDIDLIVLTERYKYFPEDGKSETDFDSPTHLVSDA